MGSVGIINLAIVLLVAKSLTSEAHTVPLPVSLNGKEIRSGRYPLSTNYASARRVIPWGFHHIGNHYYYFSKYTKKTEYKKIKDYLRGDKNHYWIGGTDHDRKHFWKWAHDKSFVEFAEWGAGYPTPHSHFRCLGFTLSIGWWDWQCSVPYYFVCEI
ncbi:hypothetical protein CHUAL_007839 [Chamberlinius hualienensis]